MDEMNNSMFLKGHEIQVTFTHNVLEMGLLWSLDSIRIHGFVLQVIAFFFVIVLLIPTFFIIQVYIHYRNFKRSAI